MQKCVSGFLTDNGREVRAGDFVSNDDPVLAEHADKFEDFDKSDADELAERDEPVEEAADRVDRPVEEATAAPGEKRTSSRATRDEDKTTK